MNIDKLSISPKTTVKDALRKLDEGAVRILFVVDDQNRLLGTLTDGDVRRHILRNGDMGGSVDTCYNGSPTTVAEGDDGVTMRSLMLERKVEAIPVVDATGHLLDCVRWSDIFGEKVCRTGQIDVPVVIMAGGKGTRLDPFTKILPKPLIPIGDKPIVEHIMDRFHEYGARDFYLTINYKGEMIRSYFDNTMTPYKIHYVREEEFMGTAGSLRLLPDNIPDTFILSNCDVIIEANYVSLIDFHKKKGHALTIVGSMQHYRIPYGVIGLNDGGTLASITEKPEYDLMVNTGLYVLDRSVLDSIPGTGQFHMTDLASRLMEEKRQIGVFPVSEKAYVDIGQWAEYRKNMERMLGD